MKKVLSMFLSMVMLLSMTVLPVLATEASGNWNGGTQVSYNAEDPDGDGIKDNTEAYTVTVPAQLAPSTGGEVVLAGTWASDRMVIVTADEEVVLKNNINENNTKTLAVTFTTIEQEGSNTSTIEVKEDVSVEGITNAIFGTWSGTFNYFVDIVDAPEESPYAVQFNKLYSSSYLMQADDDTVIKTSVVFYENGAMETYMNDQLTASLPEGTATYDLMSVAFGGETMQFSEDGAVLIITEDRGQMYGYVLESDAPSVYFKEKYSFVNGDNIKTSFVFYENGAVETYTDDVLIFQEPENTAIYGENYISYMGLILVLKNNRTQFEALGDTFTLENVT